jgi:hypothetical protein
VIAALKPHGKVSIWTSTSQGTPDDAAAETQRLRDRGVDGVIDLGPPLSTKEQVLKRALDVWESDPVRGARDVAQTGVDIAESGLQTAGDIAGAGVDIAREGASHLPVVGGWFD